MGCQFGSMLSKEIRGFSDNSKNGKGSRKGFKLVHVEIPHYEGKIILEIQAKSNK